MCPQFDGTPNAHVGLKPQLGGKVQEQMGINLKDELDVIQRKELGDFQGLGDTIRRSPSAVGLG